MDELLGALDQGTSSTRFVVFSREGRELGYHQVEHRQLLPHAGWVEHDAEEIWRCSLATMNSALAAADARIGDLAAIGIANQRETTVVWSRVTGAPVGPAIVWQDTRTAPRIAELRGSDVGELLQSLTGLPVSTYASATKVEWILRHLAGAQEAAEDGELLFGTIDSWLTWKLTGHHVTDVTNASRTMLMNLDTLEWDDRLLEVFGIPRSMLPRITSSSRPAGDPAVLPMHFGSEALVGSILGDQHAALVGQGCFSPGDAKNTYGTGNFLLINTGTSPIRSRNGLISTVAFQMAGREAVYALEGSIAVTGAAVQWLRDQLGIVSSAEESGVLAATVPDTAGLYFVPAFSGLYAPHWRGDARGVIVGLTQAHTRAHLARAALEASAFQSLDVLDAAAKDTGHRIDELHVDGGMTANDLCMQIQADVLGVPIVRARYRETTVLGAAIAAGLAAGLWRDEHQLPPTVGEHGDRFEPRTTPDERATRLAAWRRAVEHSLGWAE